MRSPMSIAWLARQYSTCSLKQSIGELPLENLLRRLQMVSTSARDPRHFHRVFDIEARNQLQTRLRAEIEKMSTFSRDRDWNEDLRSVSVLLIQVARLKIGQEAQQHEALWNKTFSCFVEINGWIAGNAANRSFGLGGLLWNRHHESASFVSTMDEGWCRALEAFKLRFASNDSIRLCDSALLVPVDVIAQLAAGFQTFVVWRRRQSAIDLDAAFSALSASIWLRMVLTLRRQSLASDASSLSIDVLMLKRQIIYLLVDRLNALQSQQESSWGATRQALDNGDVIDILSFATRAWGEQCFGDQTMERILVGIIFPALQLPRLSDMSVDLLVSVVEVLFSIETRSVKLAALCTEFRFNILNHVGDKIHRTASAAWVASNGSTVVRCLAVAALACDAASSFLFRATYRCVAQNPLVWIDNDEHTECLEIKSWSAVRKSSIATIVQILLRADPSTVDDVQDLIVSMAWETFGDRPSTFTAIVLLTFVHTTQTRGTRKWLSQHSFLSAIDSVVFSSNSECLSVCWWICVGRFALVCSSEESVKRWLTRAHEVLTRRRCELEAEGTELVDIARPVMTWKPVTAP